MGGLWVPPEVGRELVAERHRFAAGLDDTVIREKMLAVAGLLDEATYRLRSEFNDPLLEVVRAPDKVPVGIPMKPAYYVVIRWNTDAPPTIINVEGPDGEFVDLDGHMDALVAMMRRNRISDPRVRRAIEARQREEERQAEREKEREKAERLEELRDRVNAATRTTVSMNGDTPWTQNANGKRYRRRES